MAQRLNDEQLEIISRALVPLFDDLEQAVIVDIARRINKTLTYTRTAELQAMEMRKLGYSPNKIRTEALKILNADAEYKKIVEKNTIDYKKEVKQIIADIVEKAKEEGDEIVANSGEMSWIDDMRIWESANVPLTDDSFLPLLVRGIQKQVGDEILNLSQTTGFKDINGFTSIENMYRNELNRAVLKIASGTFSADAVTKEVIHNLAQSGLRSIDYASGRSVQIDSAVRLAVRTGCAQLSGKMTDENIQRTEQNLVQVSAHWGARNKGVGVQNHEEWQGKIYYIVEPDYSLDDEAKRIGQESIEDIWEKTGYSPDGTKINNPLGLYGYNCRHRLYPFFEGVSEPLKFPPEPSPKVIGGKEYDYYAMTQKMRQMERKIRNLKREREAVKRYSGETKSEDLYRLDNKIADATEDYKNFCRDCNMRPSSANIRYEANSSDLTKTKAYAQYQAEVDNKMAIDNFIDLTGKEVEEVIEEPIPWMRTEVGRLSGDALKEVKKYANDKQILLTNAKWFDGDASILKDMIDCVDEVAKDFPELKNPKNPITINIDMSASYSNDFAITRGHIINIPWYQYRDLSIIEKAYKDCVDSKLFVQGTTYKDIIRHELGHAVNNYFNAELLDIVKQVLPNMSNDEIQLYLADNLSIYSIKNFKNNCSEVIAEVFCAKYSGTDNKFALQFFNEYVNVISRLRKE